jgi:adenylylsulfate kinase
MGSTVQRSFLKGITWEIISFIITFIFVYLIYGDFNMSITVCFFLSLVKIFFFFAHERIWKKIMWGKNRNRAR